MINVEKLARVVLLSAAVMTLAVMIVAAGPWVARDTGQTLLALIMMPFLAAWAVGPYFICNRFMNETVPEGRWVYVVAAVVAAIPVLWIYIDALILSKAPDAQAAIVFVVFPLYQFVFILAVYYAVRFWRGPLGK